MSFNPKRKVILDTETTGLRPWHGDDVFAVILMDEEGEHWTCEWDVDPKTRTVYPNKRDIRFIRSVTEDPKLIKDGHNLKFDQRMLGKLDISLAGKIRDTLIGARVCRTGEMAYGLDYLANRYGGYPLDDTKTLAEWTHKARAIGRRRGWALSEYGDQPFKADYWMVRCAWPDNDALLQYMISDGYRGLILSSLYEEIMAEEAPRLEKFEHEMALYPFVYAAEERGVALYVDRNNEQLNKNKTLVEKYLAECRERLVEDDIVWWNEDKRKVVKSTGQKKPVEPFNPASPQQLKRVLYSPPEEGGYGLECVSFTKPTKNNPGGGESTNWKALRQYAAHPFVRILLAYRAYHKAIDTFFGKYDEMKVEDPLVPGGWCVHPWFNQAGAKTGRFSCQEPNLQQVADSRGFGQVQARGPFGPRPGYAFYLFDYSQQESRIFAEVSQIQELIDIFLEGRDVNTELANRAWGGKGNPYALQSAAYTLELGTEDPQNEEILEVWKEIGWSKAKTRYGVNSPEAHAVAEKWLSAFDYDIVKADKSVNTTRSRTRAKIILFAKIFGGGADAVKDLLYCSRQEAKTTMSQFDQAWPGIQKFMDETTSLGRKQGYVETLYGNRLDLDDGYEYRGVNYLVQGTAAAMMKDSMLRCGQFLKRTRLDAHIVMTVHDELAFEIRKDHAYKWLLRGIKGIMEDNGGRIKSIPMLVECKRAVKQWDQKVSVEF